MGGKTSTRIFVNYRIKDTREHAYRLYEDLRNCYGNIVFIDKDEIEPGTQWSKEIWHAISSAWIVLTVIGSKWESIPDPDSVLRLYNKEDWVRQEIEYAIDHNKTLVPLVIKPAEFPPKIPLPDKLQKLMDYQKMEMDPSNAWSKSVDELCQYLENHHEALITFRQIQKLKANELDADGQKIPEPKVKQLSDYLAEVEDEYSLIPLMGVHPSFDQAYIHLKNIYISLSATQKDSSRGRQGEPDQREQKMDWDDITQKIKEENYGQYIETWLKQSNFQVQAGENWLTEAYQKRIDIFEGDIESSEVRQIFSTAPLGYWLKTGRHLLIEGQPGSGKTTALKYIAWTLASGSDLDKQNLGFKADSLPVFITLSEFVSLRGHLEPKHEVLFSYLTSNVPQFEQQLSSHCWVLLFDGLDEVRQTDQRTWVARILTSWIKKYPKQTQIVLASRPAGLDQNVAEILKATGKLGHVRVENLNMGEVRVFIRQWYEALVAASRNTLSGSKIKEQADDLIERIKVNNNIRELTTTPVLLTGLVSVHAKLKGALPEKRAKLYEVWLQGLLKRRPSMIFEAKTADAQVESAFKFFAKVAHEKHCKGDKTEVVLSCQNILDNLKNFNHISLPPSQRESETACVRLLEQSGLFKTSDENYVFAHQTFQEFLTARWLIELPNAVDILKDRLSDSYWKEVFKFYFAHLAQVKPGLALKHYITLTKYVCYKAKGGISKVFAFKKPTPPIKDAAMLAEILIVLHEYDNEGLFVKAAKDYILASWVQWIEDKSQPGDVEDRIQVGHALGLVGDPRLKNRWVHIPKGQFWRGAAPSDDEAHAHEKPSGWVTLTYDYKISRWPVTVEEYRHFIEAHGYLNDEYWSSEGLKWRNEDSIVGPELNFPAQQDNWPVTGVSWFEAEAYCQWLTQVECNHPGYVYRLPTEAEWERAARGSRKCKHPKIIYPWGDVWNAQKAMCGDHGVSHPAAVGLFTQGHSVEGLWDMSGNIWEWCVDEWVDYSEEKVNNPIGLGDVSRVFRGGAFFDGRPGDLRVSCRGGLFPWLRSWYRGFRVVLGPRTNDLND